MVIGVTARCKSQMLPSRHLHKEVNVRSKVLPSFPWMRQRGAQEASERIEGMHEFPAAESNVGCCKYCSSALCVRHSRLAAARFTRTMGHLSGWRPRHWRTNLPAKGVQPVSFRSRRGGGEARPRSGFAGGGGIQHERISYPDVESRATHVGTIKDQQYKFPPVY